MNRSYRTMFMVVGSSVTRKSHSFLSHSFFILVALIAGSMSILAPVAVAQVTTGNIAGSITSSDGSALPGVTIEAVHVPTGTHYSTVSGAKGYFQIPNARVGGPYRITASLEGFRSVTNDQVEVPLGETANVPLKLQLAAVSEAITVMAKTDAIINPEHTGSTSAVSEEQMQTLPTVNRSLQDFARTNPYFSVSPTDDSGTFLTVAGRNNRYNNIQIDGAVNNDLFGLASSGTPGGQTGTQPISLDAVQTLQLVVSPYDVRQSGFTGGGINAVTRSGTNKFDGSVFGSKRDKSYIGKGPFDNAVSTFDQSQWGGRLGGPILGDRLFFFVSGEENRRQQPIGAAADGSTGINYGGSGTGSFPSAAAVRDFLVSKYKLDPGSLGDLTYGKNSNLLFGRLDMSFGAGNTATLRHNYVDGVTPSDPSSYTRSTSQFFFPTSNYQIADKTNSTVAQINSVFGGNSYNEGRIGYQTIRDIRAIPVNFPTVEIGGSGERNGAIQIGTERFSGANSLDQKVIELTDDFTWVKGSHSLVFGTHNESFDFTNLFIPDFNGYYYFPTLDAFEAGTPTRYKIGFANGSDPKKPTAFKAGQYSLYVNDQWRMNNTLSLTFGLRADKPHYGSQPSFNPLVQSAINFSTSAIPSESVIWEPRLGFNWDPMANGKQQLRGGIGVFQGRAPYVWISNGYGGTGIETTALSCLAPSCTPPVFNPDPSAQPRNLGAGAVPSIALTDPNFRFPRVLRTTLAYDRELFWGIRGTAEALLSKTQSDIYYYNENKVQTGVSPLDGRPTYSNVSNSIGDAILLSNTRLGRELTETVQLNKAFQNLTFVANYAHQTAKSAGEGQSSVAFSNWQFNQLSRGDIFRQELATSSFQLKDRYNIGATYHVATGSLSHAIGLYYDAEAGEPYSLLIGGDPNKDGTVNNDLLSVPANGAAGVILCPSNAKTPTATAPCGAGITPLDSVRFSNFISSVGLDPNKAAILQRNNLTQPWNRRLDFHYELGLPQVYTTRVLVTADVLNLLNMFDKNSGVARFVGFGTYKPVNYQGQDAATGKPIYREAFTGALTPGSQFSTANIASRWQGRLGLRVNF
jgi:Carboxypeptidase regulatory-like domain/TonB-dependent Receptor Plug Domain